MIKTFHLTKRLLLSFFVILSIFHAIIGCKSTKEILESNEQVKIVSGKGFRNFSINSTDTSDVIKELGKSYVDTTYLYPNRQLQYDQYGVSFIYREDSDIIWNIIFYAPFNGITDHGIVLGKSSMTDVKNNYGDIWWQIGYPFTHWGSMHQGIVYQVEKEGAIKDFPLDANKHIGKVITQIEVFNNDHFYKK